MPSFLPRKPEMPTDLSFLSKHDRGRSFSHGADFSLGNLGSSKDNGRSASAASSKTFPSVPPLNFLSLPNDQIPSKKSTYNIGLNSFDDENYDGNYSVQSLAKLGDNESIERLRQNMKGAVSRGTMSRDQLQSAKDINEKYEQVIQSRKNLAKKKTKRRNSLEKLPSINLNQGIVPYGMVRNAVSLKEDIKGGILDLWSTSTHQQRRRLEEILGIL